MSHIIVKKRVDLSTGSFVLTTLALVVIVGFNLFRYQRHHDSFFLWLVLGLIQILLIFNLIYLPMRIVLTDTALCVERPLWAKTIPLADIADVRACQPSMGVRLILGSRGSYGYWGWYSERDLGKYFAYYGRSSDCFLVTLKDGRKYMLGCTDSPSLLAALRNLLDK